MKSQFDNLKKLFGDRTFRTLVLALIFITAMGSTRPVENYGVDTSTYWARKGGWEKCADIALAGDSRVLTGLSPKEMQKYFPVTRICNYGFGAAWFSEKYLERLKGLLDPDSADKTIILGISPHSLLRQATGTGQFFSLSSMSGRDRFMNIYFGVLIDFFDPLSFKDALKGIFPSPEDDHTKRTFYPDGWVAVHREHDSTKKSLRNYRMYYEAQKADPDIIESIISFVEECVGEGIRMYGFIPPTCREMYKLESAQSGLDEEEFIKKFKAAGGIWIETDPEAYHSFDGSHLQDDSAIQFTRDLCKKITRKNDEIAREEYSGK